ncbi:MAG: signal peptide peptidase SppA [Novosphingobium sp.]
MIFARKVWHVLVAVKDGLALLFLLLFFLALFAALSSRSNPGAVRDGALLLKLDGAVVEEPQLIDPIGRLMSSQIPNAEYRARDIVMALRSAARDDRIKLVVLDLARFTGGGQVHMQEIGQALDLVRAAQKPVLTYATLYADDALLLAAHSSEVWVDPLGGAFVAGPGGKHMYYGKLLERLKVDAHVFRVGTFKSAVEPYIRNDMSPEAREAGSALYGALFDAWKADVAKARPKANLAQVIADPAGWLKASGGDGAQAAVAAGLVDKIGDPVTFGNRVAELAGKDPRSKLPGAFAHTNLRSWLAANQPKRPGKTIGVITIAGEIVDGKAGPGTAGGERIARLLDEAQDDNLAALVVRVDSPGGSVLASEQIRNAINRFRARQIPVVVSMANLAASGGYWVSTPASQIFAEPSTITGSIGVFAVVPSFERALGGWGVNTDGVKTTPLSGQPDVVGGLSPEISAILQANVEHTYGKFLGLVGQARGKTTEEVDAMAQGRVWDGGTARQKGLVDQFGGLDEALAYAAGAARLGEGKWHPQFLGANTDPYTSLFERLTGDEDSDLSGSAHDLAGLIAIRHSAAIGEALTEAERLVGRPGAQAYCLDCPIAPAGILPGTATLGLLARIRSLIAQI